MRESIDLTTPTGRLLVHLIAALAEFERELIRERVRAGVARVRATGRTRSGKAVGRPRRVVDVGAVARLLAEGRSWREIAVALKVPEAHPRPALQGGRRTTSTLCPTQLTVDARGGSAGTGFCPGRRAWTGPAPRSPPGEPDR